MLVVWSYNLDTIIPTCKDFEDKLIKLVWNQRSAFSSLVSSTVASTTGSDVNLTEKSKEVVVDDKEVAAAVEKKKTEKKSKRRCGLGYWFSDHTDVEKTADGPSQRPVRLFAPFYGGIAAGLSLCSFASTMPMFFVLSDAGFPDYMGSGTNIMIQEIVLDGSYVRLALLVTLPFLYCISLVMLCFFSHCAEVLLLTCGSSSPSKSSGIFPWCTSNLPYSHALTDQFCVIAWGLSLSITKTRGITPLYRQL